jgi:hypothetical protein
MKKCRVVQWATGGIATRNVDEILALDADVVTDVGRADRRGRHGHQRNSRRLGHAAGHRDVATGHSVQFWIRSPIT